MPRRNYKINCRGDRGQFKQNFDKIIFVQKYSTIDVIFSIHCSQIENQVESEKHVKARFFNVRTNPTLGVSSNMGWGVSEQCWMYRIICGVN